MHSDILEGGSQVASPTVQEIISNLRTSFFEKEFQNAAETLVRREQHMNQKYIDLKKKAELFEKERDTLSSENLKLYVELKKKQSEIDAQQKEISEYKGKKVLNSEKEDELKKKQSEIDALKELNKEYERKATVHKKRFLDLGDRVSNLENSAKELVGNFSINLEINQLKNGAADSSKYLLGEKTDSCKKTEPNSTEIIEIDDDDDGDLKCISKLKRKRVSKPLMDSKKRKEPIIKEIIKVQDDDDDLKCTSPLKTKRVSDELIRKINADFADSISAGSQSKKLLQETHNQPSPSHPVSTTPKVKKPAQKTDDLSLLDRPYSKSGPAMENSDEALKSVIAKIKAQRGKMGIQG